MTDLRPETFADAIGEEFHMVGTNPPIAITLDRIVALPVSAREGGGFVLEFTAGATADIPQGTYELDHRGVQHAIFVVPVARQGDRIRLEAVFN